MFICDEHDPPRTFPEHRALKRTALGALQQDGITRRTEFRASCPFCGNTELLTVDDDAHADAIIDASLAAGDAIGRDAAEEDDPTPDADEMREAFEPARPISIVHVILPGERWCAYCGAMTEDKCHCVIADNN